MAKNTTIVKELKKYEKSDEFKSLLEYSKDKQEELRLKNREIIKNRKEIKLVGSYIDEKLCQIEVLEDFIKKISNDNFKKYLETRVQRYWSSIDNSTTREEIFASEVDLNKVRRTEYFAIKYYIKYCIDMYTEGKEKDFYKGQDPYC